MDILSYKLGQKSGGGSVPTLVTKNITANGTYNASSDNADGYSQVTVEVQPNLQSKSVTITENGNTTVSPDTGYDGLSQVSVTTNVPTGTTIQSISDWDNAFVSIITQFSNFLYNLPNSYTYTTTDNITLYTPSADNKKYVILKKSSDSKYKIYWLPDDCILNISSKTSSYVNLSKNFIYSNKSVTGVYYFSNKITISSQSSNQTYYSSADFSELSDALSAIKSSETVYTSSTGSSLAYRTNYDENLIFAYTNTPIIATSSTADVFTNQRKISSNETIAVIE